MAVHFVKYNHGLFLIWIHIVSLCTGENQSHMFLSKVQTSLSSSIDIRGVTSAIHCVHDCLAVAACLSASYNTMSKSCILHPENPLNTSTVLVSNTDLTLFYPKGCLAGWDRYDESCFKFNTNSLSWVDSKTYCNSLGASLAIVKSNGEHTFIRAKCQALSSVGFYWIGARWEASMSEFRWVDNSTLQFTAWADGQGNSRGGCVDYLAIVGWLWNDHWDCVNTKGPSICEKSIFNQL